MTAAHWHLILNHLPIIGTTLCTFLLIAGLLLKNEQLKIIALALIIIMSVFGFIVHETGEKAERQLKNDATINQAMLEEHEEAAKPAFIVHNIAGLLSITGLLLYKRKKKAFNIIAVVIVALSLSAAGFMSYAGYLGGKIKHGELNSEAIYTPVNTY
jgi:uncharacterized membrane protein YphA (DoxX/SURF4 family)